MKRNLLIIFMFLTVFIMAGCDKNDYKKVLSCDSHVDMIGIVADENYTYYINDGELAFKYVKIFYLDQFHSSDYLTEEAKDTFAKEKIEESKNICASGSCTYTSDYKKGKILKGELSYSVTQAKELLGDFSAKTADELYDILKTNTENGYLTDGQVFICK